MAIQYFHFHRNSFPWSILFISFVTHPIILLQCNSYYRLWIILFNCEFGNSLFYYLTFIMLLFYFILSGFCCCWLHSTKIYLANCNLLKMVRPFLNFRIYKKFNSVLLQTNFLCNY